MIISYEDRLADAIRRQHGLHNQHPLDMTVISYNQGISVEPLKDALVDNASGHFIFNTNRQPVIRINTYRSLTHQRFTFAHELGHYFLNHGTSQRDTSHQIQKHDIKEMAANRFASGLLMPAMFMKKAVELNISIQQMSGLLGVSENAIKSRLDKLDL